MVTEEEVAQYYDQCEAHYRQHLKLDQCLALHYGYWTPDTATLEDALRNTNKVLAAKARIGKTDRVLDAGCGVGGSTIYLARTLGCRVLGITLSRQQVETARAHAAHHGVSDLAHFERRNYCHTGLQPESFNVIWAVESVCQANDKKAFIDEAYRLLRPDGRLVMADYFQARDSATTKETRIFDQWLDGWAIPGLARIDEFKDYLRATGFHSITVDDATQHIRPSAKKLYHRFFLGFPIQKLYEWFAHPTEIQKKNVRTAKLQYDSLKRGLWTYHVVLAVK